MRSAAGANWSLLTAIAIKFDPCQPHNHSCLHSCCMQAPYGSDVSEQLLRVCRPIQALLQWLPILIQVVCAVVVLRYEQSLVSVLGEPTLCVLIFVVGCVCFVIGLQWP